MRLGTWLPFEQVPGALAFFTGVRLGEETARRHTEAAGAALVEEEDADLAWIEAALPPAPAGPPLQQLSADGAMVPLVHGEWAEVKTLAIGTVGTRTTRDGDPVPHTTALSYFSRLADAESFGRLATVETHRRGTETAGVVCAVVDGAEWLQDFIDLHRPDAVRILDFPHAAGYVSAAAQAVWGADTAETSAWLDQHRHALRHGDPDAVLAALEALPVAAAPAPEQATARRDEALGYLRKRRAQIAYAVFAAQGYPIGSGCAESADKLVVAARLKGSGMHWARRNVTPMVALRAMACSDRWAERWPAIWRRLRDRVAARRGQRRADRRRARRPPAPPPPPPPPPRIVQGRPTAAHPWKRPACLGGYLHHARRAKP